MVVNPDDVDPAVIKKKRKSLPHRQRIQGSSEIIEKMIGGRIRTLAEISLVEQPFEDPTKQLDSWQNSVGATVTAMVRFEVGEGIEKEEVDFAEEVMAQARGSH